jgi:hypothetical protein
MRVREHRDTGALQPRLQLVLRSVNDDEVRLQREQRFNVGIKKPADARQLFDLGRIRVVAAHGHNAIACVHGKEHLCRCGHQ